MTSPFNDFLYGNKQWLLDWGASRHMIGILEFLSHIQRISPCFIGLPNGSQTIANFEGIVKLGLD